MVTTASMTAHPDGVMPIPGLCRHMMTVACKTAGKWRKPTRGLLAGTTGRPVRGLLRAMLIGAAMFAAHATNARAASGCVDVALVLAVDGSGSVDAREYHFQKAAISASLRDPDVLMAMKRAGTVAMAIVYWGDAERATQSTDAVVITGPADAERLAATVERMNRNVLGNTGLGAGLTAAMNKLASMGCAHRSIVNVSGDGEESVITRRRRLTPHPQQAKARALAEGITINALVVSNEVEGLAEYYARNVIAGPGAFVMNVNDYGDYAAALRRKLIREITPSIVSQIDRKAVRLE